MPDSIPLSKLKRQMLDRKQIALRPYTRKPAPAPVEPDEFPKPPKMKYLELKYKCKMKLILFSKSLSDCEIFFKNEVDRSTLSRWRKRIEKYLGIVTVGDHKVGSQPRGRNGHG